MANLLDWLKKETQEAWGGLGNEINRAIGGAGNQVQGAANNIRNVVASQPRNIQRGIGQVGQTIGRAAPQIQLPPPNVLENTLKQLQDIATKSAYQQATRMLPGGNIPGIQDKLASGFGQTLDAARPVANNILTQGKGVFMNQGTPEQQKQQAIYNVTDPASIAAHLLGPAGPVVDIYNRMNNAQSANKAYQKQVQDSAAAANEATKKLVDSIPTMNLADKVHTGNPVVDTGANLIGSLADMVADMPHNAASGVQKLTSQYNKDLVSQGGPNPVGIEDASRNIVSGTGDIFNAVAPVVGGGAVKNPLTGGKAVLKNALTGAEFMAPTGFVQGYTDPKNKDIGSMLTEGGKQALIQGAEGAAIGGVTTGVGKIAGAGVNKALDKSIRKNIEVPNIMVNAQNNINKLGNIIEPKVTDRGKVPINVNTPAKVLGEKIARLEAEHAISKEALDQNPAGQLMKYANKRTMELPEVVGTGKGKFAKSGDSTVTELGFRDSEHARAEFEKYAMQRETHQNLTKELNDAKSTLKSSTAPQVGKAAPEPTTDPKLLDIKISKAKDPARKAQLIAEKQANIDATAPKVNTLMNNPKEPGAIKRAWQSVSGVISQYGEGGKAIASGLEKQRNQFEIGQAQFIASIPGVGKLNKNEMQVFAQSLESLSKGESVKVSPKIKQAITEWNQAIPKIRERAIAAGLDVGDLGPNYFPRMYRDAFDNNKKMGKIAERMVADAKAKGKELSLGEAMGQLQFMKNEYQRPFGNLEKTREFDVPGYDMSHDAVYDYITRSFDRITKAEQFGAKNEKLNSFLAKAQQDGYNATPNSVLDKYIKIALGDVDKGTPAHKVSSAIRKFNAVRSLSTAGVSNATQTVNTATIAGIGRTIKGMAKTAFSKKTRAEVDLMGVSLDNTIKTLSEQGLGTGGKISRNIASPFFATIEKFNREATAVVGVDYGNHLAKRAAKGSKSAERMLREKFGVEGNIGKTLTPDQQTKVARKLVELSQFKVDPRDLPGWVDSPMGKIVAQFRTFGYKQTDFMYNQVLREATKGNLLPLTRFVGLAVPAGAGSLYIKGKIKGVDYVDQEESLPSKGLKYLSAVGGLGLPGDTAQNLYKSAQYGNLVGGIAGVVGGPTASLIAETSANVDKGIRGNWTALQKEGVRNIPMVGPSIANRAFPTEEQKIKSADETSPGIKKLEDDKGGDKYYVKDLDKKFKSEAAAKRAIDEKSFTDSGSDTRIIGDNFWYKDKDGEPKHKTVVQYKYDNIDSKASLEMDRAKARDDLNGWMDSANKKWQAIEDLKGSLNSVSDQGRIDDLTLKQENLKEQAAKFSSYGGFTKPKKGRSGGSGGSGGSGSFITTGFKTAAQLKAPKVKGISVRKPTYKSSSKKLAVSKMPKVTGVKLA